MEYLPASNATGQLLYKKLMRQGTIVEHKIENQQLQTQKRNTEISIAFHLYCFRMRIPDPQDASPWTNETVYHRADQEAPVDGRRALCCAAGYRRPSQEPCPRAGPRRA